MSVTVIGPYNAGEIAPPLVVTFKDSTGAALDFSTGGPWVGKWIYRPYAGVAVTRAAVVSTSTGATKGQLTYTWVAADLAVAGDYEGEMWVGNAGGGNDRRYDSVRFVYQVRPAIAIPAI